MSGNALITVADDDFMVSEEGGAGTINMNGCKIDIGDAFKSMYDDAAGGTITINMTAGEIKTGGDFHFARKGVGTFTMSGGVVNIDVGGDHDFKMAEKGDGDATLIMSGDAAINLSDCFEMSKDGGTSYLEMSGGFIDVGDDFKMGQGDGATATIVMTGGLITVGDGFKVPNNSDSDSATVTLGDGTAAVGALGDATIDTMKLDMSGAAVGDDWIDFFPGGLLLIREGDVTGDIATLISGDFLITTYVSGADWWDTAYGTPEVGYDFGDTVGGSTAVYLVPEPATIALLGFGALALIRKKR